MGPLSGVRILDLSRVLAGPWATQVLADLGADVIKIERPEGGDDTRQWGPPFARDPEGRDTSEAAYYLSTNRGKQSVAIDLGQPAGADLVRQLAAKCDVFVENFKVGGLAKYGLAYADILKVNPSVVYCSISAFGQDGPEAANPGYDAMIQGMGGLMSITGVPEGLPGAGPQKVGVAVVDLMTGMYAVAAITGALYERRATGLGQYIDLALLDTQLGWLANQNMNFLVTGKAPQRQGTAHPNIVPYQACRTSDGYLMLAVGNDRQFANFCNAAGSPAIAKDPRFATNAARVAHRTELIPQVEAWVAARTTRDWLERLNAAGVPCGPINDIGQAFAEPQVIHRGMRIDLPHPTAGSVPGVKNPINYSRTPIEYTQAPPLLGQHTDDVLAAELGLDDEQRARLREAGVIR